MVKPNGHGHGVALVSDGQHGRELKESLGENEVEMEFGPQRIDGVLHARRLEAGFAKPGIVDSDDEWSLVGQSGQHLASSGIKEAMGFNPGL